VSKKILANILLVVFLMQFIGMIVMYFSQRYAFEQSAFKLIASNKKELNTILQLSELEFQLAKFDEHELFINGELYDIASKEIKNGIVTVKVFRDTEEESFLKNAVDLFDTSSSSKSSLPKLVLKTFFNPIVLEKVHSLRFYNFYSQSIYSNKQVRPFKVFIQPATPPPLSFC